MSCPHVQALNAVPACLPCCSPPGGFTAFLHCHRAPWAPALSPSPLWVPPGIQAATLWAYAGHHGSGNVTMQKTLEDQIVIQGPRAHQMQERLTRTTGQERGPSLRTESISAEPRQACLTGGCLTREGGQDTDPNATHSSLSHHLMSASPFLVSQQFSFSFGPATCEGLPWASVHIPYLRVPATTPAGSLCHDFCHHLNAQDPVFLWFL